jgi:hypothetical protein
VQSFVEIRNGAAAIPNSVAMTIVGRLATMNAALVIARDGDARPSTSSAWCRFAESYVGRAVLSPFHAMALGGLFTIALFAQSAAPLLLGGAICEALVVAGLPRWPAFRRRVDRQREETERAQHEQQRRSMLARMSEEHRLTVIDLDKLACAIRVQVSAEVFEMLSVDRLIDTYVKLAVVHDEAQKALGYVSTSDMLWAASEQSESEDAPRHYQLVRQRLEARRQNREKLSALRDQMRTIEEGVKLLHERTLLAIDPQSTTEMVEELLTDIDRNAPVIETMMSIRADDV